MTTYKITRRTDGYIASRNYNGKTQKKTIESGLTLKEAQSMLLDMFNRDNDTSFRNWGLAVAWSRKRIDCAYTSMDGSRSYSYDSRTYGIEEDVVGVLSIKTYPSNCEITFDDEEAGGLTIWREGLEDYDEADVREYLNEQVKNLSKEGADMIINELQAYKWID